MNKPEFDAFAEQYDHLLEETIPDYLNEDSYFTEYKIALMKQRLGAYKPLRILDFGCGSGKSLIYLAKYFPEAELWGFDVSTLSLKIAKERVTKAKLTADWATLQANFDVILAANVFHHIPKNEHQQALTSCFDLLKTGGNMFLFEHNPLNPMTRWVFERCPLDKNAEMLSLKTSRLLVKNVGFGSESHGYSLFFPKPLAFLRKLEKYLIMLPLGAQYFIQMTK